MRALLFLLLGVYFISCSPSVPSTSSYVLQVKNTGTVEADCAAMKPDTIQENNPIQVFNKSIQRYASALLCLQSDQKDEVLLEGFEILDLQGNPISLDITQEQRDSVIMEFLKFARSSSIPYHETVKNFELKMMSIR